ncbi:MAG: lysophospholipase [Vicinamibacteria bacterium]|jgi:alpha-beta hydrolase superfamily lysophospholipase|nr:lysophospholipase [Vicinamibacteria bacterium]
MAFPERLPAADGIELEAWHRAPAGPRRAAVVLMHGLNDHSRALPYERLTALLLARGIAVYGFDLRGHGRSGGPRMYTPSWAALRDDLLLVARAAARDHGARPALVGLSLGGLLCLSAALAEPLAVPAVVAMAPALDRSGTSALLRALLPLVVRIAPRLRLDPGLDVTGVTSDAAARAEYVADPLWESKVTPALGAAVVAGMEELLTRAGEFSVPLLAFHGTADRLVPIAGTRAAFPRFGSADKRLVELEGAWHALPLEPQAAAMADEIAEFVMAKAGLG